MQAEDRSVYQGAAERPTPPVAVVEDRWCPYTNLAQDRVMGSSIVRTQMTAEALLRSQPDRLLFLQDGALSEAATNLAALQGADPVGPISVHRVARLPSFLATARPHVLHHPGIGLMPALVDLRSQNPGEIFPVCACHHAVSYTSNLHELFLALLLSPTLPCDVIISPTGPALQALQRLLEHVASEFAAATGVEVKFQGSFQRIPYGVDTRIYRPTEERNATRQKLALPQDAVIILYHGRLDPCSKADLRPLLLAFRQVAADTRGQAVRLVISGQDSRRASARLEETVAEMGLGPQVTFITDVSFSDLPDLYGAADVFVSPSDNLQEAFGVTLVEAMACGLPVIASNWDGYRDIVRNGETGLLVDTVWARCDDPINLVAPVTPWPQVLHHLAQSVAVDWHGLVSAMRALVTNPALRSEMGRAGRQRATSEYDWATIIPRYQSVWQEQLERARMQPARRESRLKHARPRYCAAFRGYASRELRPEDGLRLAPHMRGSAPLATLHPYPRSEGFLDTRLLQHVLALLTHRALRDAGPLPVERLTKSLRDGYGATEDVALLQIMWLLKYGYILVERCQSRGPE